MDPELAAALSATGANNSSPTYDVAMARASFDEGVIKPLKEFLKVDLPPDNAYKLNEATIPVDGGEIRVRYYVPASDEGTPTYPVLVHMHGGGWSIGSIELDDYSLRQLCVKLRLSIANIAYRLAPEHPFPTAVYDCLAALKWVVENTALLQADLSKGFIVGGCSSGGNLSAVLAHMARDDPFFEGRRLTGQLLREAFVCHPDAYPESLRPLFRSREEHKDTPPVTRAVFDQFRGWYNAPPRDPRFSPLLYPYHAGLPRAYIQAMELDSTRDDGVVYAEVLREAGVEVKFDLHPGVTHGFHYNWPHIKAAVKVREELEEGIKWLLNQQAQ
ncbi:hypothetical protein FKP32DRAFT_1595436 [Trametes sanguinea]|nr:hypothetical protein FKP32DRAFT_1595436 [Trametes sanguinea]